MGFDADLAPTPYLAAEDRYESMTYRRCGRSGLQLPVISLGLWQNFGDDRPLQNSRAITRRAIAPEMSPLHPANNYGPPRATAEINCGRILGEFRRRYRGDLVLSARAGYDMWPGPYGEW